MTKQQRVLALLKEAKQLAREYYDLTGRPLGVTGEVAEYEAIRLLKLEPCIVRQSGFDAIRRTNARRVRIQIKGRCILPNAKPGQRMGRVDLTKQFDTVMLVILDRDFNATAIYEASRGSVARALLAPGSRARNERGALAVSKFKAIGTQVWPVPPNQRLQPAARGGNLSAPRLNRGR